MTADRDQSIERLLRDSRAAEPGPPADCPDAETLAAVADDTMPAAMRREIEGHVAGCHRCQEVTATMARTGALSDAAAAVGDVSSWKRRALNWLVPAAAAATAVALWVLVPGRQAPAPTAPAADTQVAATPPALPPLTPEVIISEPLRIPGEAREENAAARPAPATAPASPPPVAAAAPPPAAAAPPPPPAPARLEAQRQDQAALKESVAVQQERALGVQARRFAAAEILSPDPQVRWRIGPGPIVQHSTDGGATWIAQQTGGFEELTAGSAPTPDVCWLVGRGGVVLLTTNGGRQWQRVMFPEAADLVAITATSARSATVTLGDGRRLARHVDRAVDKKTFTWRNGETEVPRRWGRPSAGRKGGAKCRTQAGRET
jgi:hypothetical protein